MIASVMATRLLLGRRGFDESVTALNEYRSGEAADCSTALTQILSASQWVDELVIVRRRL